MICDKTGNEYTRPQTKGAETHPHEGITQKVVAKTIGLDIVPVQPMSPPTSMLYFIDYIYDNEDGENN